MLCGWEQLPGHLFSVGYAGIIYDQREKLIKINATPIFRGG
jgi:hypothetical protein